jgi:site-specific recombinase XerD
MVTIDLVPSTRRWLDESAASIEVRAFAEWLQSRHYRDYVIDRHVRRLLYVAPRLIEQPFAVHRQPDVLAVFARERRPDSRRLVFAATGRAYVSFLASEGRLDVPAPTPAELVCADYDAFLREVRGLSASARAHHRATVRQLLADLEAQRHALGRVTRDDVERFIALCSRNVSRHTLQHAVAQLRAFLRYAHDVGLVPQRLDGLDTPRTYRDELPPRALPWRTVRRLLASIDRADALGRRDRCILHLIAYYGLRPSDVVSLCLGSVDWTRATLQVTQRKTRSPLELPLDVRTVRVLGDYVRRDRAGARDDDPLFLRGRCPAGALQRNGVGDLFRKRMRLAGLPDCGKHVYRLRHTLAMRLLSRGVGVKAIGDVLGHRSFYGTAAYLRLDVSMLRDVALPVPRTSGGAHA